MRKIEFASPTKKEQIPALTGTNWDAAELLAGGTDLLALMKDEVVNPRRLVNIKGISELRGVRAASRSVTIGALTPLQDVADNATVMQQFPALHAALNDAASPQIRNMATIGGNLCQRPRCWYFRNGFGLLAMKDGKSLVLEGDNRYHAILGNQGPAYFVSPSTIAPVLIAYDARMRIMSAGGQREIAVEKFFRLPQNENEREHDLKPGELVVDVFLTHNPAVKAAHYEVRQKHAFDWPLATAAVALTMSGKTVQSARVVLGHVAPTPWLSAEAAEVLRGKEVTAVLAEQAGAAAVRGAKPLSRNGYKIQLARVAVKRAIMQAAGLNA